MHQCFESGKKKILFVHPLLYFHVVCRLQRNTYPCLLDNRFLRGRPPHIDGSVPSTSHTRAPGKQCSHTLPHRLQVGQGGATVALRVPLSRYYIPSRRKSSTRDFVLWRGGTSSMAFCWSAFQASGVRVAALRVSLPWCFRHNASRVHATTFYGAAEPLRWHCVGL